jgi:DNA repair protein RadD
VGADFVGSRKVEAVTLRLHQLKAIDDLRSAYRAGHKAPVLVMSTGGGKTHTSAVIIREAVAKGRSVWFLAHLREILDATSAKLTSQRIPHGHIMAGRPDQPDQPVQIVMVQTAARRLGRYRKPDLIVIDECHLAVAETYRKVIEDAGRPHLLGLTATPVRLDGRGLDEIFDTLVPSCTTQELIAQQLLVPIRYFAPSQPDLTGVRTVAGDYAPGEVADRMNRPSITGSAVEHYRKLAHGRPAVAFATNVKHANDVASEFAAAGYRAMAIGGHSPEAIRREALHGLNAGDIDVVVNCQLWVAGVDAPGIGCVIMLAPTQSVVKYLQSIGRGLRTAPGKRELIVLDHAGNCFRHGLPTDSREWALTGTPKRTLSAEDEPEVVRQCERCFFVYRPAPECPACGHRQAPRLTKLQQRAGELAQIEEIKRQQRDEVRQARTIEALRDIAIKRGYSIGWVYQMARVRGSRSLRP